MIVFNGLAFVFGLVSLVLTLAVGRVLGWIRLDGGPADHFDYALALFGGLLACVDLAFRFWRRPTPHAVEATRANVPALDAAKAPVVERPKGVTEILNVFLSGARGAQLFWIIPGWVAGLFLLGKTLIR